MYHGANVRLADIDDVYQGDGMRGVEELERRRQYTSRDGRIGLPANVKALLIVQRSRVHERVDLFTRG